MGDSIYEIDPNKCTECVGHFNEPQCQEVCPVECIILDEEHVESKGALFEKFKQLNPKIIPL